MESKQLREKVKELKVQGKSPEQIAKELGENVWIIRPIFKTL